MHMYRPLSVYGAEPFIDRDIAALVNVDSGFYSPTSLAGIAMSSLKGPGEVPVLDGQFPDLCLWLD